MEDLLTEAMKGLVGQGPLGILSVILAYLLFLERKDKNREVDAHNETREKRIAEYKTIIDAIGKLSDSVDSVIATFRSRGDR